MLSSDTEVGTSLAEIVKRFNCLQMAEDKNEPKAPSTGQKLMKKEDTSLLRGKNV